MHTMVLGFAGYGLLLSSCVTLIMLLRMGCIKDILKSPLHILSTSDTVISMITSIILLINQSIPLTNFHEAAPISKFNGIENRQLLEDHKSEEYYQNQTCMRFYHNYNGSWPDSQDLNGTIMNCTFQNVLMHYAMFLVPFANAFISLLIYSVQCSSGMSCVDEKCSNLTAAMQNMQKDLKIGNSNEQPTSANPNLSLQKRETVVREDLNVIARDPEMDNKTQETILTIFNDGSIPKNSNNNPKYTGFGLITQWLAPVLVTAILYFSKTQNMNKLRDSSEMECIFKINFPLESCNTADLVNLQSSTNPDENYNELNVVVEEPDTLRISYPDSEVIDEVVSSVRNIVQSALNKTCYNSTELKNYNTSRPWNITKYITMNNFTQQIASDENEMLIKLSNIQQTLSNNDLGIFRNNECTTTNGDELVEADQQMLRDEELKLFEDVVENVRLKTTSVLSSALQETKPEDLLPQEVVTTTSILVKNDIQKIPTENTTDEIPESKQGETTSYVTSNENKTAMIQAENVTGNINGQIYADIIKRIRDTVIQVKMKERTGNLRDNYYEANDEKFKTSEPEISSIESDSIKIRKERMKSFSKSEEERLTPSQIRMDERCFLSTKFLKTHLLILLFFIYFIPVLVSGILQTRATYMCKNVFEKIEAADRNNLKIPQIPDTNKITIIKNPSPKPGWFLNESEDTIKTDSPNSQDADRQNFSTPFQTTRKQDGENGVNVSQLEDEKTGFKNILQETKSMQILFSILKKSLMLGILMWTPAFLEILSKVFLCASTPAWLVNILYLLGVSFGIVKNFFNVIIAKVNKNINDQIYRKENSIYPSV